MNNRAWAVLVGIDRYRYSVESGYTGAVVRNLRGCCADLRDVRALLEDRFAFDPKCIITLTDEEATHKGILDAIDMHLVARTEPGDLAVLYFAGHGSSRIEGVDRAWEGTLVPHDARGPGGIGDIGGKELSAHLGRIGADRLTIILDSCYSGQIVSARAEVAVRGIPPHQQEVTSPRGGVTLRGLTLSGGSAGFVLLAASAPTEPATELMIDGTHRGTFSYYLTRHLREMPVATYRETMDRVRSMVSARVTEQHPQLEGPQSDRYAFGEMERPGAPSIAVWPEAGRIRLDAGRVHGVTRASRYTVGAGAGLIELEVEDVHAVVSFARQIGGPPLAGPARAVAAGHAVPFRKIRIAVSGLSGLPALLQDYAHLDVVESGSDARADIRIARHDGIVRWNIAAGGKAPDMDATGRFETLLNDCRQRVLHWARWLILLRIENDQPLSGIQLSATPDPNEFHRPAGEYYEGERVRYSIENRSGQDVFVSLLSFGDDGSVRVVYPRHFGPSRLLPAGGTWSDVLEIESLEGPDELNVLKLFATTQPTDFHSLSLGRSRSSLSPLEEIFEAALSGARLLKVPTAIGEWATAKSVVKIFRAR